MRSFTYGGGVCVTNVGNKSLYVIKNVNSTLVCAVLYHSSIDINEVPLLGSKLRDVFQQFTDALFIFPLWTLWY